MHHGGADVRDCRDHHAGPSGPKHRWAVRSGRLAPTRGQVLRLQRPSSLSLQLPVTMAWQRPAELQAEAKRCARCALQTLGISREIRSEVEDQGVDDEVQESESGPMWDPWRTRD